MLQHSGGGHVRRAWFLIASAHRRVVASCCVGRAEGTRIVVRSPNEKILHTHTPL